MSLKNYLSDSENERVTSDAIHFILHFLPFSSEYERLKKEKEEKAKKDREDQLKKVQQDLGKGEAVAMETIKTGAQAIESAHATPFHISLGADLDSDDDDERGDEEEWDEEEIKEHESFKRFLEKEKQKGQHAKKEESG